jgi:hypothetical protein
MRTDLTDYRGRVELETDAGTVSEVNDDMRCSLRGYRQTNSVSA